jgi:general secretion pathway protein K
MRANPQSERGAALILVVATIAVITAVAVDLAYNTRVSLQIAANGRDELRAHYLAKSAVNLSRMVLYFQKQLDGSSGALGGATGGRFTLNIRLWDLVPIDSNLTMMFLKGAPSEEGATTAPVEGEGEGAETAPLRAFGDFDGAFRGKISDEDGKINVLQLDSNDQGVRTATYYQLQQLIKEPKYDFLFDEEDANGMRVTRDELIIALRDWVDINEASSSIVPNPLNPIADSSGDENGHYDRLSDRYKAKNARFDSLDELYLVAGVSDAFFTAFGPALTVYPAQAKININNVSPAQLLINILAISDPRALQQTYMALANPNLTLQVMTAIQLQQIFPGMGMSLQSFVDIVKAQGIQVTPNCPGANCAFTDKSTTFTIEATGVAGGVSQTIRAVVTNDNRAAELGDDLPRVIHWSEGSGGS